MATGKRRKAEQARSAQMKLDGGGESKYAKKGGAYKYSGLYSSWLAAVKDGRDGEARRIGQDHTRACFNGGLK